VGYPVVSYKLLYIDFRSFGREKVNKDNSHTGLTPQRGEEFSDIQIYGGRAGEDTFLVVDNFKIIEGD
jgi:hypothetical protein